MSARTFSQIAGVSYLVIFFCAIFANFVVLEALLTAPVQTVVEHGMEVRLGIVAFLIAALFDVVVAWALRELYGGHVYTSISTYLRVIHATLMGAAVFALIPVLSMTEASPILAQVEMFNWLWLIGLFFFGAHLIFLGRIVKRMRIISILLTLAGIMYIIDTAAHILLPEYHLYAGLFLAAVAVPAILGEMSFALRLLISGAPKA